MATKKSLYRKNFSLIIVFLVLITVTLIIALVISYNLTAKYVENEFASKKVDVEEQTVKPYNDFFQTKIPEITFYQGFLDSSSAAKYAGSVFNDYPFVNKIVFYSMKIGAPGKVEAEKHRLAIAINAVYHYRKKKGWFLGPIDIPEMTAILRKWRPTWKITSRLQIPREIQPKSRSLKHFMISNPAN